MACEFQGKCLSLQRYVVIINLFRTYFKKNNTNQQPVNTIELNKAIKMKIGA